MKIGILLLVMAVTPVWRAEVILGETSSIDPARAREYFEDLKRISDGDAGHLWGVPLYGPTIFVDPNSRFVVANQMDRDGRLTADQGVYVGTLEPAANISNTATEWSGTMWTMVNWDAISPTDPYDRARLLIHESWHRIQKDLGIPSVMTSNAYLDEKDGRIYLLLEFRALVGALLAKEPSAQAEAISDALTLRLYRQSLYPKNNENAFERHEGMAEYTGLKLCGITDSLLVRIAAKKLQLGESYDGLANSFAYLTGPAFGLLLDHYNPQWRGAVRSGSDLPALLAAAISWQAPAEKEQLHKAADLAGNKYEATKLIAEETAQAQQQEQTVETYRNRLLTHGRLLIKNNNLNFSFNPLEKLISFDTTGVIYKTMRLTGDFGVLEVTDGILRTNDWQLFVAVAPDQITGNPATWAGYRLQLQPGWQIVSSGRGTFVIEKK
jgi:hypothetical protein